MNKLRISDFWPQQLPDGLEDFDFVIDSILFIIASAIRTNIGYKNLIRTFFLKELYISTFINSCIHYNRNIP